MKHHLVNDLDVFKILDPSSKTSLKTCFSLCEVDRLKLNTQKFSESIGFTDCQELEEKMEKKTKHGDFPYKTRADSQKTMYLRQKAMKIFRLK